MVRDHRIETYDFPVGSLIGATISCNTWRNVNGVLLGVQVKANNWAATGSLLLQQTGIGQTIWSLVSGTSTGNVAESGIYYPVTYARTDTNTNLSGTSPIVAEIPLFGEYTLVGLGMGTNKSGLGVSLIYKMG